MQHIKAIGETDPDAAERILREMGGELSKDGLAGVQVVLDWLTAEDGCSELARLLPGAGLDRGLRQRMEDELAAVMAQVGVMLRGLVG